MSDLVGNLEDRFSPNEAHVVILLMILCFLMFYVLQFVKHLLKSMIEDVFIQYHTIVHSVWHYYVQPKYNRPVSARKVIGRL